MNSQNDKLNDSGRQTYHPPIAAIWAFSLPCDLVCWSRRHVWRFFFTFEEDPCFFHFYSFLCIFLLHRLLQVATRWIMVKMMLTLGGLTESLQLEAEFNNFISVQVIWLTNSNDVLKWSYKRSFPLALILGNVLLVPEKSRYLQEKHETSNFISSYQ